MSRKRILTTAAAFAVAGAASIGGAWVAANYVEATSKVAVTQELDAGGLGWASVVTDGLQLVLTGIAPDEPARFRAITRAGAIVDPRRIIDAMEVQPSRPATVPRFSLEILRNDADVSVIGLVPSGEGRDVLNDLLDRLSTGDAPMDVTNMVEAADHAVPDTWEATVRFAISILDELPRSKVSVEAGRIVVTAVADSDDERIALERELNRSKPRTVTLVLDIASPRPVITPFTLRFVIVEGGRSRFEACAVDSEVARTRVLAAAAEAGFSGNANCVIGLGVPSASWSTAASEGIGALAQLGGGALTLSDADVSLIALEGTDASLFDTVVSELDAALPELFLLSAVLPEPTQVDGTGTSDSGPPEFVATLSPEGQVQLRGRLYDDAQKAAVFSVGRALFGVNNTYAATRSDETLPQGWPVRVLAGLEALSRLEEGVVVVQPDLVVLRGVTGDRQAEATISGLLSAKLGAEADFRIEVIYDEELDPVLNIPTPEECETRLNGILVEQKLTFAPGESVIEEAGDGQLARLTDMLKECRRAVFEIGGHTDSQGREESNLALSVGRAEAVRAALISRGVPPSQLVSKGYGEAEPISDNETEEGREDNRRITFTLLGRSDREEASAEPAIAAASETGESDAQQVTGPATEGTDE
ncbi:OmpA-OmpF porin, OOP family [Jannaschia faecimaris]|uniref:OmpA-OmpF porin, OOP family n=1 Tax=Jannaschia faecimaris TaxID=1244108 RepID=A0A1H3R1E0_9RHOB|nr:OmpA family protein [Jannaschia faecimaris]SDZ18759.1 OmpA-OmpF porin, OOP family [Jannaschia faecimaris]